MTERPFHYAERLPSPALTPWIWNFWEFRIDPGVGSSLSHHVPPDGCASVTIIHLGGAIREIVASGAWLQPFVVPLMPGGWYFGWRFRPEAGALALGTPAASLIASNQPLRLLAPELAASLARSLAEVGQFEEVVLALESVLAGHLANLAQPEPLVRRAVDRLVATGGSLPINHLASELDISPRTLLRRFRAAAGLSPKQFARTCRFRKAAGALLTDEDQGWSRIAHETGFADQAHLIHEFRGLTGLTPEALGSRIRQTRHQGVEP